MAIPLKSLGISYKSIGSGMHVIKDKNHPRGTPWPIISGGPPGDRALYGLKPTQGFLYHSSHPNFTHFDHSPVHANDGFYVVTANNKHFFTSAKYGQVMHPEESDYNMDRFLAEKPLISAVEKQHGVGILFQGPERLTSDANKRVRYIITYGTIDNNRVGIMLSEQATSEYLLRRYSIAQMPNFVPEIGYVPFTDQSIDWAATHISEGYDVPRELKGVGAGNLSKLHLNGVTYGATLDNKYIALSSTIISDAWELANARGYRGREAQAFVDKYIENVIEHELAHLYEEEGRTEDESEFGIRTMHGKKNADRAALHKGTLNGRIYDLLSEQWYASAEAFTSGRARGNSMSKLEAIAEEATEEAREMGLEGDEAVAYVKGKVNNYVTSEEDGNVGDLEDAVRDCDDDGEVSESKIYDEESDERNYETEAANDNYLTENDDGEMGNGNTESDGEPEAAEPEQSEAA